MYKVFNQSKAIIITKNAKKSNYPYSTAIEEVYSTTDLSFLYKKLLADENLDTLVFNALDSEEEVFNRFASCFTNIFAAGGVIFDESDRLLMIYRYHKWDLPKGRIEKGEARMDAAIRESEEETGIQNLSVIKELQTSYYVFSHFNTEILKTTYWYKMKADSNQNLTPQLEEHIEVVEWMNKKAQNEALKNTYPSIIELLKQC